MGVLVFGVALPHAVGLAFDAFPLPQAGKPAMADDGFLANAQTRLHVEEPLAGRSSEARNPLVVCMVPWGVRGRVLVFRRFCEGGRGT